MICPVRSSSIIVGSLDTEKAALAVPSSMATGNLNPFSCRKARISASRPGEASSVSTE